VPEESIGRARPGPARLGTPQQIVGFLIERDLEPEALWRERRHPGGARRSILRRMLQSRLWERRTGRKSRGGSILWRRLLCRPHDVTSILRRMLGLRPLEGWRRRESLEDLGLGPAAGNARRPDTARRRRRPPYRR